MANEIPFDVTPLFRLAQDWYLAHPGEQIPLPLWADKLQKLERQFSINSGSSAESLGMTPKIRNWVEAGKWKAYCVHAEMIPALAAITLGFCPKELSNVLRHHGVRRTAIDSINIGESYSLSDSYDCLEDAERISLNDWLVTEQVVNAMCLDPQSRASFISDLATGDVSVNQTIACVLADLPEVWPSTALAQRLRHLRNGDESLGIYKGLLVHESTLEGSDADFRESSNQQRLSILERSGEFVLGMTSEYGFANDFFYYFFEKLASRKYSETKTIGLALNTVECPIELEKLNTRLIEAISDYYNDGLVDQSYFLINVQKTLDPLKYRAVIDDIVLKINLLEMDEMHLPRREEMGSAFDVFYDESERILAKLSEHLLATKVEDFRKPHFNALGQITSFKPAQDVQSVDMTGLICKSLEALEVYDNTTHYDYSGTPTNYLKKDATVALRTFLKYAIELGIDCDYQRFSGLSSKSARLLADAGFAVKKLPGMTNKDRGQVLSDQLGL
jgi:hypothetical protein